MRDRWLRVPFVLLIGIPSACTQVVPPQPSAPPPTPAPVVEKKLEYNVQPLSRSLVHTLKIPANGQFRITTAVAERVQSVEEFATATQAIAVLNGGFFDPENQKSTSSIFHQGQQVAKPEDNERLMNNLDLLPYLDKILNRTEFRRYQCGASDQYAIAQRQDLPPVNCQLQDALGAGPRLIPFINLKPEGFLDIQSGTVVRDPLGHTQPNARSAIGLTRDGSILWILAAQRPDASTNSGLSLPELADFMKKMGVVQGMNLDGGTSSAMFFQGETFYGKVNETGAAIARPVKSVLLVQSTKKLENNSPVQK